MLASLAIALAAGAACAPVPAGFADEVRLGSRTHTGEGATRRVTALCARAGGRRLVLRRAALVVPTRVRPAGRAASRRARRPTGAVIGGAAAAGRKVAWVETRFPRGRRVVVVYVVRIGERGRVHPQRRVVVRRDRSRSVPDVDVAITARGELAWLAPVRRPADWNEVVYDPPHGRLRKVGLDYAGRLAVEDRITLRWSSGEQLGFFELPRPAAGMCPRRTGFRAVASNATIAVTGRTYFSGYLLVLRACMLATGRDREVAQAELGADELLDVVGLDRRWIVLSSGHILRTMDSCRQTQRVVDGRTGGMLRETVARCDGPPLARAGAPLAVTSRGVAAWVSDDRLLAAAPGGGVGELDRGRIEGLRARGTLVEWTSDGTPRSMELP